MRILHRPGWLLAVWSLAVVVWGLVPVVQFASTWGQRGVGIALAFALAGGLSLMVRSVFRRVAARPPVYRGADRWLVRLPAWVLAPLMVCVYMIAPVLIVVATALHFHRFPAESVWGLSGMFLGACLWGGYWPLAWRAQRENHVSPGVARV
jgi:hypothetical protein